MDEDVYEFEPVMGIREIFNEALLDSNSHSRLWRKLAEIHEQNAPGDFIMEFMHCLYSFIVFENQPSVDRALDFASLFLSRHYQDMEDLVLGVCEFIFENHNCKAQDIRLRCCYLMSRVLFSMDEEAGLPFDTFENISLTMQERLQDKIPSVRAQAVLALQRVQNPSELSCPVMKALLFHMQQDPSHDVRANVVNVIALAEHTLPLIFERTRDVHVAVRIETYKRLSRLKALKLTMKQRQKIFSAGASAKSEAVESIILNNIVPSWFEQCRLDYITFLKLIYVETMNLDHLEKIMFHLFKLQPSSILIQTTSKYLSEEKLLTVRHWTPEHAILLLLVMRYFSKSADDGLDKELIGNITPELTKFSEHLMDFGMVLRKNDMEQEFIVTQMFKIAATYCFPDEIGRMALVKVCVYYLINTNVSNISIPAIAKVFELLVTSVKNRLYMMSEIISNIKEPLQPSSSGTWERVVKNDRETLLKCLTVMNEFLKAKDVQINVTLLRLKEDFVMQCFTSPCADVQALALDIIAFYCIRNLNIAKQNFVLFCLQVANSDATICLSALRGMMNVAIVHGLNNFISHDETECEAAAALGSSTLEDPSTDPTLAPSRTFMMRFLISLMRHEVAAVRALANKCIAKLMLCGHVSASVILARLVFIWWNPTCALQPEIRDPVETFLNMFPSKSEKAGGIILNCIIPALKAAKEVSRQKDDEFDRFAELIVSVLKTGVFAPPSNLRTDGSFHLQLATRIYKELLDVKGLGPLELGKMISGLHLETSDGFLCKHLLLAVNRSIEKMGNFWEKKRLKTMKLLKNKLENVMALAEGVKKLLQESTNKSPVNDTKKGTLLPIPEEDSSESLPDVSASYGSQQPGQGIDDSDVLAPESPNNTSSPRKNMIIDETVDEGDTTLQDTTAPVISASTLPPNNEGVLISNSENIFPSSQSELPSIGLPGNSDPTLPDSPVSKKKNRISFNETIECWNPILQELTLRDIRDDVRGEVPLLKPVPKSKRAKKRLAENAASSPQKTGSAAKQGPK